ncbi:ABC transporter substrate-binding protein [Vallitalea maricola]|uniref:ABC transporter substrate-binding protein n=1 Tax=Vallitalea maricola TaxID=3074433 RepID=A0ACB5UG71_9FIRM|nr:ABC transporter substrate-binding protein [Vallitalea sp. AN17-2]
MINSNLKRSLAILLTLILAFSVAGCGSKKAENNSGSTSTDKKTDDNADSASKTDKPFEGVVLHYGVSETSSTGGEAVELVELVKEKTGIQIDFTIIPNTNAGEVDKQLVSLMAGDDIDIVYGTTQKLKTYYQAGVLEPLNELAEADNYDIQSVFGDSVPVFDDGLSYGLPAFNDIWLTFYNKKIFDEAGVEYPTAEGWTWEKYIETAKKLTNADADVWGSFMLDYDCYNYLWAMQSGAQAYNEDGTSNFDDSLFAKGLQFYYDLGNVDKVQPDSIMYASGAYPWNSFVASGNMGMFVCGGWVMSMMNNFEKYPRDWEFGILPMPYPEGQESSTLAVTGAYGVSASSKNADAAFEAIKCMAENQYKLGHGRIPARTDLTDQEISDYVTNELVPAYSKDNVTEEDFVNAWFNPERKIVSEKIIGTADTVISQIWTEEGQMYGQGAQSLEDAIAHIKERSDKAIKEDMASDN